MFKVNEHVRILKVKDEDNINAYGRISFIGEDGRYWVSNFNMPYCGTISEFFNEEDIAPTKRK